MREEKFPSIVSLIFYYRFNKIRINKNFVEYTFSPYHDPFSNIIDCESLDDIHLLGTIRCLSLIKYYPILGGQNCVENVSNIFLIILPIVN